MDAAAAQDNMHLSELFGRTIRVNVAKPNQRPVESGGFAKNAGKREGRGGRGDRLIILSPSHPIVWNTAGHAGYGGVETEEEKGQGQAVEVRVAGEEMRPKGKEGGDESMTALDRLRQTQKGHSS